MINDLCWKRCWKFFGTIIQLCFFFFCVFFLFFNARIQEREQPKNHLEDKIRTVTQPLYKLHTNYRFLCLIWYIRVCTIFFLSCASRYNCGAKSEWRASGFLKWDNFGLAWEFRYPYFHRAFTPNFYLNIYILSLLFYLYWSVNFSRY